MGLFGGLDRDTYDRQYDDKYIFSRLAEYFRPQVGRIATVSFMGLALSLILAFIPIIIAQGVGRLEDGRPTNEIMLLVGALFITIIFQYVSNWIRRRAAVSLIAETTSQMRKDAFSAALDRDMAFYDENKTGKILSRITSDTEDFGQVLLFTSDVVSQVIQGLILAIVLINLNIILTLILVVFLIPVVIYTTYFRKTARRVTRQGSRAMAEVNDVIQETVTGISVAKNFRQEHMIYEEFTRVNEQSYSINLRRGIVLASVFPILNSMAGIAIAAIVYVGANTVVEGIISAGVWYLFLQSVDRFWFPVINISSYWSQFQQAISALERILAIIDAENTVNQTGDTKSPQLAGRIRFEDITFAYKNDQNILEHFNLDIGAGESIAFVGHTGAGKSSIAKLIMRLYEFQSGQLCIDDHDVRTLNLQHYRQQIGFVPQMPFLFSGTIADNIRYARPQATMEEIEAIAQTIGNGEWLETVPNGLQSDVGERGSQLSIGQRQLISLLRVLLQKPAIFILDEATASIDSFTEAQIQEALDLILSQSTSILIAHRLSTVQSADRIIVLRDGGIIEQGNHEALMEQSGYYAELYNTYFRHQSLSYIENAKSLMPE